MGGGGLLLGSDIVRGLIVSRQPEQKKRQTRNSLQVGDNGGVRNRSICLYNWTL